MDRSRNGRVVEGPGGGIGGGQGHNGALEIDPGMASSAIALLAGGVLMLTDRKKK
jgi:hypothetical protein